MNRTRRLRKQEGIRRLVKETKLSVDDFVYPLFIEEGENIETEIVSMPGIKRFSLDRISKELDEVVSLNIPAVLLFGIPAVKDEEGTETWNDNGIIQQAIRFIKKNYPSLYVITDVCFCEYTSHGHCGIIHDNDVDIPMNSKAEWHQPAVGRVVVLQDLQEVSGQEGRGSSNKQTKTFFLHKYIFHQESFFLPRNLFKQTTFVSEKLDLHFFHQ